MKSLLNMLELEKDRFKIVRPLLRDRFITLLDMVGDIDYANAIGGLR